MVQPDGNRIVLGATGAGDAVLAPVGRAGARLVAGALAAIDPWLRLGIDATALEHQLTSEDAGARKYLILSDGTPAGAVIVRDPWLAGPYLQLLAVLPAHQGRGLGGAALGWLEASVRDAKTHNIWVCASAFNVRAQSFYEARGFRLVARLEGLLVAGEDEILMRKRV